MITKLNPEYQEKLLKAVWESSADAMRIANSEGIVMNVNAAYCELTGFKKNALIGKSFEIVYDKKEQPALLKYYKEFISSSKISERVDKIITFKNGNQRHLEASYSFIIISGEKHILSIFRDITEFMKAIDSKNESNNKYRLLTEIAKDIILIYNLNGEISYLNPSALKYTGFTEDNFQKKNIIDFIPKEYHPVIYNNLKERKEGFIGSRLHELEIINSDGIRIPIEVSSSPIIVNGEIKSILTIARDVSERKEAEEALSESDKIFHKLFEESADPILLLNDSGFVDCNQATISILAYDSKEDFLYKQPWILSPEKQPDGRLSSEKAIAMIQKALHDGYNRFEWMHKKSDGTNFPVEVTLTPIIAKGEQFYYTIWRDITERKQSEEKLEYLNEQLLNLIEAIPDAIFFKDGKGRWLITNELAKTLFKLHNYNWYGKTDLQMAEERPDLKNMYEECFVNDEKAWAEKKLTMFEEVVIDDNGETHQFHVSKVPLFEKDGSRKALVIVSMEITLRKKSEDEIRKLSSAVEQSPTSIFITDLNGTIVYLNSKTTEITGYSHQELIGQNPRIFQSGKNPHRTYKNLWSNITSGKEWRGEFHNKKKNGELYWESAAISPILDNDGNTTHYLAIKEDITERKNIISELKIAKDKAETGDKLKTAFMQNISHEIRTPLNGILGFAQIMSEPDLTEMQRTEYLGMLNESSQRLIKTITDYMDISLIVTESININLKTFDLNNFLYELNRRYKTLCNDKNLILTLDIPENIEQQLIITDKEILQKIFTQLLDNALKFTKEGTICFGFNIIENSVEFFVKDTGIGVSNEAKENVFNYFTQEDTSIARGYEGSGLGLAIAKGFLELLGGSIRLESEKGAGTDLCFTLPVSIENIIPPEKLKTNIKSKPKVKPVILFAEDEITNSRFLEAILKNRSTLFNAKNGKEAVRLIKEHPEINIILMDLKMPEMDGFEATRQIKKFRNDIPIIAITAYAQSGDEQKALEAGCDGYITKPIDKEQLFETIEKYVNFKP